MPEYSLRQLRLTDCIGSQEMVRLLSQYVSVKSILLFVLETGLIVFSLLVAVQIRFWGAPAGLEEYLFSPLFPWQLAAVIIAFETCFFYGNLYSSEALQSTTAMFISLGQSLGSACLLLAIIYFVFPTLTIGRGVLILATSLAAVLIVGIRVLLNGPWGALIHPLQNTLLIGTGDLAMEAAKALESRPDLWVQIVGFLQAPSEGVKPNALASCTRIVGTTADLERIVEVNHVTRIIVGLQDRRGSLPIARLLRLRAEGIRVEDAHSTIAALGGRISLRSVHPSWFVFSDGFRRSAATMTIKRTVDVALAAVGLFLSAPMMALVALAVRLDSHGPILYRQIRVGFKGKHFEVLKFRSMRIDAEKDGAARWASLNDPRTTRIGRYIRKYRLDELPQFINILRGDMSFVGPRPERPQFVDSLRDAIPYYDERHLVRPGLTGWAQVQFPYGSTVDDAFCKLEYDLFYLKNMSLLLDLLVVAKTLRTITTGYGAR